MISHHFKLEKLFTLPLGEDVLIKDIQKQKLFTSLLKNTYCWSSRDIDMWLEEYQTSSWGTIISKWDRLWFQALPLILEMEKNIAYTWRYWICKILLSSKWLKRPNNLGSKKIFKQNYDRLNSFICYIIHILDENIILII